MLTALGCHIYAGGFTCGLVRHFDVIGVFEDGGYGASTHRLNFPSIPVHIGKPWPVEQYKNKVSFVATNPPCAIFSAAGIRTTRGADAWRTDPRKGCWYDCFQLVDDLTPRAWCLESVTQAYTTGRELVDEFTKLALIRGYSVSHVLINAVYYGVPQKRKRFFLVLHRASTLNFVRQNCSTGTLAAMASFLNSLKLGK